MTDTIVAQTEPVLAAIDISKARHEVLIAIFDKKRRRRLTVLNQLDDFNRLITPLAGYPRYDKDLMPKQPIIPRIGRFHCVALRTFCTKGHRQLPSNSTVLLAPVREDVCGGNPERSHFRDAIEPLTVALEQDVYED